MEFVDTHTHLDSDQFADDQAAVISRAVEAGVTRLITVGAGRGFESTAAAIELAHRYSFIWATAGVHPHDAKIPLDEERLLQLAGDPRVVAVGETGLDFHYDFAPREAQEAWFRAQVRIARQVRKPIIIHSRKAGEECMAILKEEAAQEVGGVFHCFSEDAAFAARLKDINFLVSVGGVLTFKGSQGFRDEVAKIPLEQIMLETDAPYLAPQPFRGKRCESSHVPLTAQQLAAVKGCSVEDVARVTTATACNFFKLV